MPGLIVCSSRDSIIAATHIRVIQKCKWTKINKNKFFPAKHAPLGKLNVYTYVEFLLAGYVRRVRNA